MDTKFAKRGLDCRSLVYLAEVQGSGDILKQEVDLKVGINKEEAKKITKEIKEMKIKVQAQVRDELVRVTAKKIDDLQMVISHLKSSDLGLPRIILT